MLKFRGGKKKTWTKPVTVGMERQRKIEAIQELLEFRMSPRFSLGHEMCA